MFPYIRQIVVNDCHTYQNFSIPERSLEDFSHIIITGRNGAGKSTILKNLKLILEMFVSGKIDLLKSQSSENIAYPDENDFAKALKMVEIDLFNIEEHLSANNLPFLFSYFPSSRKLISEDVETVTDGSEFKALPGKNNRITQYKQYLVNKMINDISDHDGKAVPESKDFFNRLTAILRKILADDKLRLQFVEDEFEFYIHQGDDRRITFELLSAGYSSYISVLMELFIKVDLIRKKSDDFTIDPEGVVLIDEPESHADLEMQYKILPLLTTLFPNIQFIAATHSPAVMSSLENAVVSDITSMNSKSDKGNPDIEIPQSGLRNEFSFHTNMFEFVN